MLPVTLMPTGREKVGLLPELKQCVQQLERHEAVETATIFNAVIMPPFHRFQYVKDNADSLRFAWFDIAVLIETRSPADIRDICRCQLCSKHGLRKVEAHILSVLVKE